MATLNSSDQDNLRTKQHKAKFYLSILKPSTLLTAQVNNASIARGARTIAYNAGTSSDFVAIEDGQLLEVDTATGTEQVRLRSITGTASSGTIIVAENDIVWADNQVIRVKKLQDIEAISPTIRGGIFYKDYEYIYSDQNLKPTPVCIAGPHQAGFLDQFGFLTLWLPLGDSYAVAQGASIINRSVTVTPSTGVTIGSYIGGFQAIIYSQPGTYLVKSIVTDSNGKGQVSYRVHFVHERTGIHAPYTTFNIPEPLTGDWQAGGYQFSVELFAPAMNLADIPDGTLCVLWYEGFLDGVEGYVNMWGQNVGKNVLCAGYIRSDTDLTQFSRTGRTGRVTFEVTTVESLLNNISMLGSISLSAAALPGAWYQYAKWMTTGRAVHHMLKWHSRVLETCDVYGLADNTLGMKFADFTENTLYQAINDVTYNRGIFAKLVSDRLGRLHLSEDSQMLKDASFNALGNVFSTDTISSADVAGTLTVVRGEPTAAAAQLNGFAWSGTTSTPYVSVIPGYQSGGVTYTLPRRRGSGVLPFPGQVLADQTDANEKVGRVLAAANNPNRELRFDTRGNYVGAFDIIPKAGFYTFGSFSTLTQRGITDLDNIKTICRHVEHQIDTTKGTLLTSAVVEPRATGPDGVPGNYPTGFPLYLPPMPSLAIPERWSNLFIVCYVDSADGNKGKAVLVDASGQPQMTSPVTFNNASTGSLSVASLSANTVLVAYGSSAVILTIGEDLSITVGTPATITGLFTMLRVVRLSASAALLIYLASTTFNGTAVVLTVSGTTISVGPPATFDSVPGTSFKDVTALSGTKAVVAFRDNTVTPVIGRARVVNISGSTISLGASTYDFFTSTGTDSLTGISLIPLSATRALITYCHTLSSDSDQVSASMLDVSGDAIAVGSGYILALAEGGSVLFSAKLSDTEFLTNYLEGGSPYDATLVCGHLPAGDIIPQASAPIVTGLSTQNGRIALNIDQSRVLALYNDGALKALTLRRFNGTLVNNNDAVQIAATTGRAELDVLVSQQ